MRLGSTVRLWVFLLLFAVTTAASNTRFDPDNYEPPQCSIPPFQSVKDTSTFFAPSEGVCGGDANGTLIDLSVLALEYAPVLFFHPLEQFSLSNPSETFGNAADGEILKGEGDSVKVINQLLETSTLYELSRDPVQAATAHETFFRHKEPSSAYQSGAGFDAQNRSLAKVYYNAADSGHGTVTFNYFFYYAWNGEANMAVLSSTDNRVRFTPFTIAPFGIHEGDWEAMSVIACRNVDETSQLASPLAVSYRQHGWSQMTDCTKEDAECNLYKDTNHPVGFSALNSHATYPISTEHLVFTTVELPFYVNLQGVFVVDRTVYKDDKGAYKYWFPTSDNVVALREPLALTDPNDTDAWQAFVGGWGDRLGDEEARPEPPLCLNTEQTGYVPCPTADEDPVFRFVMEVMGVYNSTDEGIIGGLTGVTGSIAAQIAQSSHGPTGPITKDFFPEWLPPATNLLYTVWANDTNETEFCFNWTVVPDTSRLPVEVKEVNVKGHVYGMAAFVSVLAFFNMVVLLYITTMRRETLSLLEHDPRTGRVIEPTWQRQLRIFAPAVLYTVAYFLSVLGCSLFLTGVNRGFSQLAVYFSSVDWDSTASLVGSLASASIVVNTFHLFLIWLPQQELWLRIKIAYFAKIGNSDEQCVQEARIWWDVRSVNILAAIFTALLFFSMFMSVLCAIAGVSILGANSLGRTVCVETVGSLDDTCIDLTAFGGDSIKCGADFVQFCNDFAGKADVRAMWGALIFVLSQFYLISGAAMALYQYRSEHAALAALTANPDESVREEALAESSKQLAGGA